MKSDIYHFIGIGGIGMSGLARILLKRKKKVQGSDISLGAMVRRLQKEGVYVTVGHSAKNINEHVNVIYSTAILPTNVEYKEALRVKANILHRSDLLTLLMEGYKPLLVAGTHGKTTTSSLLTTVLVEAGLDPSFAVGGIIQSLQTNARDGKGEFFVAETDESDGSFLKFSSYGAIVTNLDDDHMDFWKGEENLYEGFREFLSKCSPDALFWCRDDAKLRSLHPKGISYGFTRDCDIYITNVQSREFLQSFDITIKDRKYSNIQLPLIGKYNVLNGAAVFAMALRLKIKEEVIREAFRSFKGVKRRMELIGKKGGVLFFDDYAHHPTEIKKTLSALRKAAPEKRIITIFQPHRFTRTRDNIERYRTCFDSIDEIIVTDIYAASENPIAGITPQLVVEKINKGNCRYIRRENLVESVTKIIKPHDIVIGLGAGDISQLNHQMFDTPQRSKLSLALIFGGRSFEHEVSISSAKNICDNIDFSLYRVKLFKITKEGRWVFGEDFQDLKDRKGGDNIPPQILQELLTSDLCFPILHGPRGEDGMIQGFLEALGLAYIGPDYQSCSLYMNKGWIKRVALSHSVATAPFWQLSGLKWRNDKESCLKEVIQFLHFPIYVKPSHLGSTIGIKCAEDLSSLKEAIEYAFSFDRDLILEKKIEGQEIEFAILGNECFQVAMPGEIVSGGRCHDYEGKYGKNLTPIKIPADISQEKMEEGKMLAIKLYAAADCRGMARVDFFLDKEKKYWFNEINPLPGFTSSSLYHQMWQVSGLNLTQLIDRLVVLALAHKRDSEIIRK